MAESRQLRPLIRQQFSGRAPGADYTTEGCLHPTRLLTPDVTAIAASPSSRCPRRSAIDLDQCAYSELNKCIP